MISSLSIRTQITLAVTTIAIAVAALSLWSADRLLQDRVVDNAIATRAEELLAEALEESDDLEDWFDPASFKDEVADFAYEVSQVESYQRLVDHFGGEQGELYVTVVAGLDTFVTVWPDFSVTDADVDSVVEAGAAIVTLDEFFELPEFMEHYETIERGDTLIEAYEDHDSAELLFEVVDIEGRPYGMVIDTGDELEAVEEISFVFNVGVVILTLGAAAATWIICGRALRPVHEITARVEQISKGNLQERVPVGNQKDEINELASTMNVMLDRLEISQLQRTQFVSHASHELRTPISVLQNQAEVAQVAPDTTSVEALAGVVLAEATRLGSMVENLLALARSDEVTAGSRAAGQVELSPVDLDEIIFRDAARSRRVRVDRSAVSAGRVLGEADRCLQIVTHLLDNAARHALSIVAIGLETRADQIVLWVEDDGAGIAEKDRELVFHRFTRLDEARSRDSGGAGLGLSVVQANAESMGGSVAVADPQYLDGARLEVVFNAAK